MVANRMRTALRRSLLGLTVGLLVTGLSPGQSDVDDLAWFATRPELSDGPVSVSVHAPEGGVQAWSFGLCHDPEVTTLLWFRTSQEVMTVRDGRPPQFLVAEEAESRRGVVQAVVLDYFEHVEIPVDTPDGFTVLEAEYSTEEDEAAVSVCNGLRGSGQEVELRFTIDGASYAPQSRATTTVVPKPEAWFDVYPPISNGPVTVYIHSAEGNIQGWSYSLCHDADKVTVKDFRLTPEVATVKNGHEPDFWWVEEASDGHKTGIIQAVVPAFAEHIMLPGETEGGFPALEVEYDVIEESTITFCEGLQGSGQPVKLVVTIHGETSRLPMQHATSTLIVDPYSTTLAYRAEPPESSEIITVKLTSLEAAVEGWAFTLCSTAAAADVLEIETSPQLEQLVFGEAPEFIINDVETVDPFVAVTQRVVLGAAPDVNSAALAIGPFPDGLPLLDIRYDVFAEDAIKFCDHVGSITFDNYVTIDRVNYVPRTREGAVLVEGALGSRFIRGDSDLSGRINVTDAVFVLQYLFLGGPTPPCMDAADANDVGRVEISDPIYVLRYLFLGGPEPRPPFPYPGVDISPETALGCERGL